MTQKDRPTLAERICRTLELPEDLLPRHTSVELYGRSGCKICGGGAILLYSPEEIRIATGSGGYLSVCGVALTCDSYCSGAVVISGRIRSLSFEEAE